MSTRTSIDLAGPEGNVFALFAILQDLGMSQEEVQELFMGAGSYDTVLEFFDKKFPHVKLINDPRK